MNDTIRKRLALVVGLDNKQAMTGLGQMDRALGGIDRTLKRLIGTAAAFFGAWKLAGFIKDATLTAARTEVLGTSLRVVGQNAGYSAGFLIRTENSIKNLGITTQEARKNMALFIQSELELADAAKLARVAQDLAVLSGHNSSEAFNELTSAIAAQRPVLLKQFGIVQDLNSIYDRQAKILGKSSMDLTEYEKKQAFLNVILLQGEKVAGVYETAMGDVGKQLTSLPRYIEEMKNAVGTLFIPIMRVVVDWVENASNALGNLANGPEGRNFREWIDRFADKLRGIGQRLLDFAIDDVPRLIKSFTSSWMFKLLAENGKEILQTVGILWVMSKVVAMMKEAVVLTETLAAAGIFKAVAGTAAGAAAGTIGGLALPAAIAALGGGYQIHQLYQYQRDLAGNAEAKRLNQQRMLGPGANSNVWIPGVGMVDARRASRGLSIYPEALGPPVPPNESSLAQQARDRQAWIDANQLLPAAMVPQDENLREYFMARLQDSARREAKRGEEIARTNIRGIGAPGPVSESQFGFGPSPYGVSDVEELVGMYDTRREIENERLAELDELYRAFQEKGLTNTRLWRDAEAAINKEYNDRQRDEAAKHYNAMASIQKQLIALAESTLSQHLTNIVLWRRASLKEILRDFTEAAAQQMAINAVTWALEGWVLGDPKKLAGAAKAAALAGAFGAAAVAFGANEGLGDSSDSASSGGTTDRSGRRTGTVVTGAEQHIMISPTVIFQGETILIGPDLVAATEAIGSAAVRAVQSGLATGEIQVG